MEFQINDIVEFFGVKGKIIHIRKESLRPLVVEHTSNPDKRSYFMSDGRIEEWHKEPTLKFLERVKEVSFEAEIRESNYLKSRVFICEKDQDKQILAPFIGKKVQVTVRSL